MQKENYTGKIVQTLDHITFNLTRDSNTGSTVSTKQKYFKYDNGEFIRAEGNYSEGLLKIIDEIISNAIDAILENKADKLSINYKDGWIEIYNSGQGYPVYLDRNIYSVEQCLTTQYAGTNYNDEIESVTTGNFGIGSKLTVYYSKEFRIETVDTKSKTFYKQIYQNNMSIINKPEVVSNYTGEPYTKISFLLDYDIACKITKTIANKGWLNESNEELLKNLILRRTYEAGVYLNLFSNVNVYFNSTRISTNFDKFISMHGKNIGYVKLLNDKANNKYNFYLSVIFKEPTQINGDYIPQGFDHISIINGVVTKEISNYVDSLVKTLTSYIKNHTEFKQHAFKTFKTKLPGKYFVKNITLVTICQYPRKYFSFKTQSKVSVDFDEISLKDFKKYEIPQEYLNTIWANEKKILQYIAKPVNSRHKTAKIKLYERAINMNKACGLFVVEGLSAATFIRKIIEYNKTLSRETYGLFSCGGVPINSLKNSTEYKTGYMMNEKLKLNDMFQSLVNVLGIEYDNPNKQPKYKYLIIATDEDEIGVGKICPLIICFFLVYFPKLVMNGFIKRFRTPVIRSKYKDKIYDFYSQEEFDNKNLELGGVLKSNYYKGLAVHSESDIKDIAKIYGDNLIDIDYDTECVKYMKIFFGEDTNIRKIELLKEKLDYTIKNNKIPLSIHLRTSTHIEQLGNIYRMIPCLYDGLLPVHRKVLTIIREMSFKKLKVIAVSGRTIDKMNYSYGDASLEGAIMTMAEIFPGSNNVPILLPVSASIGTQFGGSKDRGQARYTKIKRNSFIDLYYPIQDDYLLELEEEEGQKYQPKYYIPIVPRILLENYNQIGTGWSSVFVGRKFNLVLDYIRLSIKHYPNVYISDLLGSPELLTNNKLIVVNNKEICIGTYTVNGNEINVTQLPLGLWGKKFIKNLKDKKHIIDIHNIGGSSINIIIILDIKVENLVFERKKTYLDPIVEYLGLYRIFHRNLNFYNENCIKHFTNINDVFKLWFNKRRELYIKRISKEILSYEALLILKEGILYFIKNDYSNLHSKRHEERYQILSKTIVPYSSGSSPYIKLNHRYIINKQNCGPGELEKLIYENGDYKYIDNIKFKMTSDENILKLEKEIEELKNKKFYTWQETWMNELDELEKKYNECKKVNWNYDLI